MILLFRPSSSSDTFITASSNHLSELMWRALTSWTRLRFVDFFMRDTSSLFKWFNVKVHSWEVGGNKLETLMNILFTPAESSSLPCFLQIHHQWLIICVGNLSDSFILLRVKDTWNLELEGCFFSCLSPLQFCYTRMSANCRAIVQLLLNYSPGAPLWQISSTARYSSDFSFTLSRLRLCYYYTVWQNTVIFRFCSEYIRLFR